jgi:hypothetical protein
MLHRRRTKQQECSACTCLCPPQGQAATGTAC